MGTLYECLREARLEQFYPAFQANGITRSEALISLGMPEFCALGITTNEDKRRLMELVNIIKEVHSSGFSASPTPQRRSSGQRQTQSSARDLDSPGIQAYSPDGARGPSHARTRARPGSRPHQSQYEAACATDSRYDIRESDARDRAPNFSAASYVDMLQFMSDSSGSEDVAADNSDEETPQPQLQMAHRNVASSHGVRSSISRASGSERVKPKGYNYGVHKVATPSKTRSSRSVAHRGPRDRDDKIKVCVRKRPLTRREHRAKDEDIVAVESTTTLIVNEPKLAVDLKAYTLQHEFIFDEIFHESCSNEDVYTRAARPLISCIFNGGTATCFAYGQTGAGKTHTMLGDEETPGLYLLAGRDIFSIINSGQYGRGLHVWISFFEIYCGQLFDLLNRRNRLHAREDGSRQVCIAGLTETEATDVKSLVQTLQYGNSVRSKGATGVNPDSSRSHAILQLDIRNNEDVKVGKISFIDLAGSERASDVTDTDKQTRMEGAEINQSLLALKECIRSIDQDSRHTPFRQSKLTHILKDSFVGNSRTCMIANISPSQSSCENTLNTLRYADRVKELKRDSLRSSTVSQAMNLLMNIPPTAPSIFHPSNVLSTSTPMRSQVQTRRERQSRPLAAESSDVALDFSETPIRGHNLPRRPAAARESVRTQQSNLALEVERPGDAVSPPIASVNQQPAASTRSSALAASAASQGSAAPPPDASPSESDHTDTDSNNVTHQTLKLGGGLGDRRNTVAGSMDTEFDFPTSDFNNPEEFNDLNRPQAKERRPEQEPIAASGAETAVPTDVLASDPRRPVLKPVIYRSTDVDDDIATPSKQQAARQNFQSSAVSSPQISKHPPSLKKAPFLKELFSSDESVNDEDLLAVGPSTGSTTAMNNLAAPPSTHNTLPASAVQPSRSNVTNKRLMMPQPAVSSDLTKFTQRPSLRPSEYEPSNDLSFKGESRQNQSPQPLPVTTGAANYALTATQKSPAATRTEEKSPFTKRKSPVMRSPTRHEPVQPSEKDQSSENKTSPEERRGARSQFPKQPPYSLEHAPHPPASPPYGRQHSPPVLDKGRSGSAGAVTPETGAVPKSPADEISVGVGSRKYSDTTDPKTHHYRAMGSPTGEKSDDSTESIRASLSDQGQGGYRRYRDTDRSNMRKERSDPMLALDLQRKKQTLPDPQSISKRLTRNSTPKSGLVHRDAGGAGGGSSWKVIHDQLPSPKSGSGQTPPTPDSSGLGQGERYIGSANGQSHSEPSSLVHEMGGEKGVDGNYAADAILGQQLDFQEQHFSDGGSGSHSKAKASLGRAKEGRSRRSSGSGDSLSQAHQPGNDSPAELLASRADGSSTLQQTQMHEIPFPVPVNAPRIDGDIAVQKAGPLRVENVNSATYFRVTPAANDLPNRK
ncbi:kinesin-like protein [Elysia marginata]|uniref:Kinesin-like protein n=1 Tax=Elysia marginata TaxID=1093978 RepID=A0AAV4F8T1_9GAST|nr:kinesin-like protein [Elysia marginata]